MNRPLLSVSVGEFWGIRLVPQGDRDVRGHLTAWRLKLGCHGLTMLFAVFVFIYGLAALHVPG